MAFLSALLAGLQLRGVRERAPGDGAAGARPGDPQPSDARDPKPRNPRHFAGIEGGRKRDLDTFTHKNSGSCI